MRVPWLTMNNLLLLSPFDGLSHRFWRKHLATWLEGQGDYVVRHLPLPARHFAWRHRGNSLGYARDPDIAESWDLVIATSMTDLSALRGMSRWMRDVPVILYFHENQFAYPGQALGALERQVTSIYSALSADQVVFNSEFNRRTFLEGAEALLARMPDEVPPGIVNEISDKSSVIPVALGLEQQAAFNAAEQPLRIIWNHRWEHDKGPERLLRIVESLIDRGADFSLSLAGEQFREQPKAMTETIELLRVNNHLGHLGFVGSRDEYLSLLRQHHVVLSTALHEFQGLSVMEGICCGCLPVTPDDLSYVEYVPEALRYGDIDQAVEVLVDTIPGYSESIDLAAYQWAQVGPAWLSRIQSVLGEVA